MRVVVTRPQQDAQAWLEALQQRGHEAVKLPLLEIAPTSDRAGPTAAWKQLQRYVAVMFVSRNAAQQFFALRPSGLVPGAAPFAAGVRAWATGPGTVRALRAAGLDDNEIDSPAQEAAQFDSESLWQRVSEQVQPGRRVLIVRGVEARASASEVGAAGSGRDWLAQAILGAGGEVDFVVAYERRLPRWDADQMRCARRAAQDGSLWLFSSSEAVRNLRQLLPDVAWGGAHALATHARIAQAALGLGFSTVLESRAALADVMASIESLA